MSKRDLKPGYISLINDVKGRIAKFIF